MSHRCYMCGNECECESIDDSEKVCTGCPTCNAIYEDDDWYGGIEEPCCDEAGWIGDEE